MGLVEHLKDRIRREGPLSFRDYMDAVLYHPDFGYYSSGRNPLGREGDYYTSSDLDSIFGKLLAARFLRMAEAIGVEPSSFSIVEIGAGRGLLARDILSHHPFPYTIVERSAAMLGRQRETLKDFAVDWRDRLPERVAGCIFSNEFFDALPVHRVVRRQGILKEIYVDEEFKETEGEFRGASGLPLTEGQLADISLEGPVWLRRIASALDRGYHLAIDYGYLEREFYARPRGTLMCYWRHQVSEDPYARIGEQDITAHVNFSDLIAAGEAAGLETVSFTTQMEFLIDAGILAELEALAHSRAAEDVARLLSIKKLLLPQGMGERFKVLIQRKP
jgi:SAM-dependent MidA family methyltransferase